MFKLERIEWTNTWYEETSPEGKARVFLVGDSISAGYRSCVHKELNGEYFVTSFATSKALDNPWFSEELALAAKQAGFHYDYVHFNNGLHGWHLSDDDYREYYHQMIRSLKRIFPDSKLALALSTTVCAKNEAPLRLDEEKNGIILRRNQIVRELADFYKLPVDDLYSVALENNALHVPDGVHFQAEGYAVFGKAIADFVRSL